MTAHRASKASDRPGLITRLGRVMNRAVAAASWRLHIATANLWRDHYNPLRSLTITRVVSLLEDGERGAYADVQWTYRYIEMQDATLGALVERRTSAIQKLDWNIKVREDVPAGKEAMAEAQQAALRSAYDRIGNLSAALEFLAMASFRGYSHLEKVTDAAGRVVELAPVDQWFWVRGGLYGRWQYNPTASFGAARGEDVPLERFVIREVARPINRVALVCFVRKNLSQKDWDGFIEAYGIPAVFIVMPDNVPQDKETAYLEAAESIAGDGRGVLPGGSDVKTVDNGARGNNPFKEHIDYQDAQVVLRGTGGKLTMLNDATGLGSGNSDAHEKTFDEIAKAEAKEISEILRQQIDRDILEAVTPGEPAYAYFELAANEETDTAQVVKDLKELDSAGYQIEPAWIEEKTGYPVTRKPAPAPSPPVPPPAAPAIPAAANGGPVRNRADRRERVAVPSALAAALGVRSEMLRPVADLFAGLQEGSMSDAEWLQAVTDAAEKLPDLFDPDRAKELAGLFEAAMGAAALEGVKQNIPTE